MKNENSPAFPETEYYDEKPIGQIPGLTKREYFAAKALQGMLANPEIMKDARNFPIMTDGILSIVDELLTQLSKQQ